MRDLDIQNAVNRYIAFIRMEREFRWVWEMLSEQGSCDAAGSEEYERVFREWCDAIANAKRIKKFIRKQANIGSEG